MSKICVQRQHGDGGGDCDTTFRAYVWRCVLRDHVHPPGKVQLFFLTTWQCDVHIDRVEKGKVQFQFPIPRRWHALLLPLKIASTFGSKIISL